MTFVVVVDDEELVREGLVAIVSSDPEFDVVGTAATGAEAVRVVERTRPDVVLMDVRMPDMDGIEATPRILTNPSANPSAKVLILTTVELDDVVYEALRAGATGLLLKSVPRDQLWIGLRAAASGESVLAPRILRTLIEAHLHGARATGHSAAMHLTERQADVVRPVGSLEA